MCNSFFGKLLNVESGYSTYNVVEGLRTTLVLVLMLQMATDVNM